MIFILYLCLCRTNIPVDPPLYFSSILPFRNDTNVFTCFFVLATTRYIQPFDKSTWNFYLIVSPAPQFPPSHFIIIAQIIPFDVSYTNTHIVAILYKFIDGNLVLPFDATGWLP